MAAVEPVCRSRKTRSAFVLVLVALLVSLGWGHAFAAEDEVEHLAVIEKHSWVRELQTRGYPPNQLPMYGGIKKGAAMIEADLAFLERVRNQGYSRIEGSQKSVLLGHQYFSKYQVADAIKRFNQAWLLDPNWAGPYHGFALVLLKRDFDSKNAERFFRIAVGYKNAHYDILSGFGLFLITKQRFDEAIPILRAAVEKAPKIVSAHVWLTAAYIKSGRNAEACEFIKKYLKKDLDSPRSELKKTLKKLSPGFDCAPQ